MSEPVTTFQAPFGTHDVLGPQSAQWEGLVAIFADFAYRYGFSLALTPLFEEVGVFHRGIGENSEVAKKEMYVFTDRGDRVYALRPEGTAPIVRAYIQHQPTTPWKAWYVTPAFRYERPQAGRYRQHHQLGVEVLGTDDPAVDVEVIALAWRFYAALGMTRVRLLLNSMGHDECRGAYVSVLRDFLEANVDQLCDEHRLVWGENTLRVLDCKKEPCIAVTSRGPMLPDHLCDDCREHFERVVAGLATLGIEAVLDPRLVRGFDYYTRTTFEFVSDALEGSQKSIGGGGRYDKLAEQLGGKRRRLRQRHRAPAARARGRGPGLRADQPDARPLRGGHHRPRRRDGAGGPSAIGRLRDEPFVRRSLHEIADEGRRQVRRPSRAADRPHGAWRRSGYD